MSDKPRPFLMHSLTHEERKHCSTFTLPF